MAKKKLAFIDKSRARTFVLVHAENSDKRIFKEITSEGVDASVFERVGTLVDSCDEFALNEPHQDIENIEEFYEDEDFVEGQEIYYSDEEDEDTPHGQRANRAELDKAIHYGVYYSDADEYDYMQHMKPIGSTPDAIFIPAKNPGHAKNNPVLHERMSDQINQDIDIPNIGKHELDELELALNDEAYIEDDAIDFFDDLVVQDCGKHKTNQQDTIVFHEPQGSDHKVIFKESVQLLNEQFDQVLAEYEDAFMDEFDEDIIIEPSAGALSLEDPVLHQIMTEFLEEHGDISEGTNIDTKSQEVTIAKSKKEVNFAKAVRELENLRQLFSGCKVTPYESEMDNCHEKPLSELSDWNPDVFEEKSEIFYGFVPLATDKQQKSTRILPNMIIEQKRTDKNKSVSNHMDELSESDDVSVEHKENLGKARPKAETSEEKKARKSAMKLLKKEKLKSSKMKSTR